MLSAHGANFVIKKDQFVIGTFRRSPSSRLVVVIGRCDLARATGLIDQIHLRQHVILANSDIAFCWEYDIGCFFGHIQ